MRVRVMVFNATFSNILVISWCSVLLETDRWFSPGTAVSYLRQVGDFLRVQQFLTWDRSVIFSGYSSFLLETDRWFSPGTAVSYLRQVGDFLRVQQFLIWDRSVIFSGYSSFLLETGNHRPVSSKKLLYPEKITDLSQVRNCCTRRKSPTCLK
jgi:hypothetical protein